MVLEKRERDRDIDARLNLSTSNLGNSSLPSSHFVVSSSRPHDEHTCLTCGLKFDPGSMSLTASPTGKNYVDRGVQTSSTLWLARSISSPKTSTSPRTQSSTVLGYSSNASPTHLDTSSFSNIDAAYNHSLPSDSPSPSRSMIVTLKRQQTPYSRPRSQNPTRRVVSLPKDPPICTNNKPFVETTKRRVVSLPVPLSPSDSFMEHSSSSDLIEPLFYTGFSAVPGDEYFCRGSVRQPLSDSPHTPSPPSSPESILIIDDNNQLPKTFMRPKDKKQSFPDDEGILMTDVASTFVPDLNFSGWITWASSPPRPIPALHGPLSLPYARCPSYVNSLSFPVLMLMFHQRSRRNYHRRKRLSTSHDLGHGC